MADPEPGSSGEITLDLERAARIGFDEAMLCAGKSTTQILTILERAGNAGHPLLLTRLTSTAFAALPPEVRALIDYDEVSGTGFFRWRKADPEWISAAVVTAGTSDVPVAREGLRTLEYHGIGALSVFDVGVAGLWRLLARIDEVRPLPVVIAVAGMDAALPSVLGGLVRGAVIAVPTSTGYGVARGGETALHAALASCAPGVTVVNIDNGYGAACAAIRIVRALDRKAARIERTKC